MSTYESAMRKLAGLTAEELRQLRAEIVLNSLFVSDYENSLGIDKEAACSFFDGYADFLAELMGEDGLEPSAYSANLESYDTIENLVAWRDCVGCALVS